MVEDLPTQPGNSQPPSDHVARHSADSDASCSFGEPAIESPEFCGPSSSEFTLSVVSGNLKARGIPAAILDRSSSEPKTTPNSLTNLGHYGPFMKLLRMDPLWDIRKEEALRLIHKWCDGVGLLYPVVTRDGMTEAVETVFTAFQLAQRSGFKSRTGAVAENLFNGETNKMKIILAIGRTLEHGGGNDQAQRLFQSITEAVEGLLWNSDGINGVQLLVLVAIYHYHMDDELRGGRIIGLAARLCLEMGLHRRVMVESTFPEPEKRSAALRTFWSVYMFERRTSLGQGIPFSIQDSYVDPSLYALCTSNSLLSILLEWTKLAGKTWQALNSHGEKGADIKPDDLGYLDYQIVRWYESLPPEMVLDTSPPLGNNWGASVSYLQAVLFLRKSHLRNLIYRPVLQSALRISQNDQHARIAVDIAKQSIQTLKSLHEDTELIARQPVFFKHLLLTAFGNLLLTVMNSSSKVWNSVRAEFDTALDLIRRLSDRSTPLLQLWRRLQGLRELQAQLSQQAAAEVAKSHASEASHPSLQDLSFDELFPPFVASGSAAFGSVDSHFDFSTGMIIREQVNSLFDASAGPGAFFDFPYMEWGESQ